MSVALTSYPVAENSGIVFNIFPGFSDVSLQFKREDIQILSIGSGIDSQILITISGDITSELNIGEAVYLHAVGTTYNYDLSGKIIDLTFSSPNTLITIDKPFIEAATTGYVNYKQNWFLECKLVDENNNAILQYPQLLASDGSANGVIDINCSMPVDFLSNDFKTTSQEITESRVKFKVMYREVWRENQTELFTLVNDTAIIIYHAADTSTPEQFLNGFDNPKIFAGYPFSINFLHSLKNTPANRLKFDFDELDINKDSLTIDNQIHNFEQTDFGILQLNLNDKIKDFEDYTKYIQFNVNSLEIPDYETGDYDDDDYLTINTP